MKQYTKLESKKEMADLVKHFESNIHLLKSQTYKEAQVENDFIRPLFEILNWNVTNRNLEPERQVFQLQVTGKTGKENNKRPDYLIRIPDKKTNLMKSAFFIEAKKPIYDLKTNEQYIRQVYQYAWSTLNSSDNPNNQVRLAVLTDFEEFRFFDCQDVTPLKQNRAEAFNKHILKDWHYKDYVNKFDDLWDLFEYNNVVNGSLEKWYITSKDLADKRITPDKQFMFDLKEWRLAIAKSMLKNDKNLDDYSLTKATLLFINRIIFVKMLADRNIEDDYLTQILEKLAQSKKSELKLYELCRDIFTRLDHIYNGSMFTYDSLVDELVIDNSVLKSIFTALKPEISIYTLAAMPVEIIGNIYELFIAEQIVKKGTTLQIVSKYDEKKAGGVYYTPRYIVQYIVDNTLGKMLDDCKTPEQVAKIKVLDPACGSGSFLIVAYQKIIDWYKTYYFNELSKWTKKSPLDTFRTKNNRNLRVISGDDTNSYSIHLSHKLKSDILTNNIFGVDIDDQAVLVTKFSLSMKALEDSSHDEVIEDNSLYKIPTLPKLENNIKCGNSLIASDFYNENNPQLFNLKEKRKINTFDWDGKNGFPEIMKNGGFDIVIGNPPYVRVDTMNEIEKSYILNRFISAKGKYDLYYLFVENNFQLLNKSGIFSFIIPNRFTTSESGLNLRTHLLNNYNSIHLNSLSKIKVFKNVSVYPVIIILNKSINVNYKLKIQETLITEEIENPTINYCLNNNELKYLPNSIFPLNSHQNKLSIYFKTIKTNEKLGEILTIQEGLRIPREVETDSGEFHILKQFQFQRYSPIKKGTFISKRNLFNTTSNTSLRFINTTKPEKIVIAEDALRIEAILDDSKSICQGGVYFGTFKHNFSKISYIYLLGIINSNLLNYLYNSLFSGMHMGGGYMRYRTSFLNELPFKTIDFTNKEEKTKHDKMVSLVEQMLENQKYLSEAKTESNKQIYKNICDSLDKQIDKLVYQLFGLTEEEIKIVEG